MVPTTRSSESRTARRARLLLVALIGLCLASPVQAVTIQEVFLGPPSDGQARPVPLTADQRAQYVMFRITGSDETFVPGNRVRVEDASGNVLGYFGEFTAVLLNGGPAGCTYPNCAAYIMGTQAAKDLFTFTFDKIVDGQAGRVALPVSGGRVCYVDSPFPSVFDCLAWGNYNCTAPGCAGPNQLRVGDGSAIACDTTWGTPAPSPGYGKVLAHGAAYNCASRTNNTDFTVAFPKPVNNFGQNNSTDTDADGLIDQLDCNDANSALLWPVIEVQNERVTGTGTISWDSQAAVSGSGVVYDVIKGWLHLLPGFTNDACLVQNISTTTRTDPATPVGGTGFYYLERAQGCSNGTYGSGFAPATSRDSAVLACP